MLHKKLIYKNKDKSNQKNKIKKLQINYSKLMKFLTKKKNKLKSLKINI